MAITSHPIPIVEKTCADFVNAVQGLKHALATTPDDRVNWSPSDSARSPLQVVAHAALRVRNMFENMIGQPYAVKTPDEAEKLFRAEEKTFTTREQVLEVLDRNCKEFLDWAAGLNEADMDRILVMPFGMPSMPLSIVITFMPIHLMWHTAQLTYIQTIYGDHDWHLGS